MSGVGKRALFARLSKVCGQRALSALIGVARCPQTGTGHTAPPIAFTIKIIISQCIFHLTLFRPKTKSSRPWVPMAPEASCGARGEATSSTGTTGGGVSFSVAHKAALGALRSRKNAW